MLRINQLLDNRAIPKKSPNTVADMIPIKLTFIVFSIPTQNAL